MKKQNCTLVDVALSTHITPLSTSEIAETKGGRDGYGGSMERICRFFQKLIHGN